MRIPPEPHRLLVLLHGYKGDENSMWVFTSGLDSDTAIIAPRAPYRVEDGGFSWRPSEITSLEEVEPDKFKRELENLVKLIGSYGESIRLNTSKFSVMGFSQGAAMVSMVALLYPVRIQKAAMLAGFIPARFAQSITDRPLEGVPFFVAHGALDESVPVKRGRQSVELLEKAGALVTFCEDEVTHKVSAGCMRALKNFLKE